MPLDIDARELGERLSDRRTAVGQRVARRVVIDGLHNMGLFLAENCADECPTAVTCRRLTCPALQFRQFLFEALSNMSVSFYSTLFELEWDFSLLGFRVSKKISLGDKSVELPEFSSQKLSLTHAPPAPAPSALAPNRVRIRKFYTAPSPPKRAESARSAPIVE